MCTVLLPPGDNPTAANKYIISYIIYIITSFIIYHILFVCKCVLYYCHRVSTQLWLRNISYRIISYHHIVLFVCKCVLYYCHRVATQLQLRNISYHISYIYHISFIIYHIIYHIYCLCVNVYCTTATGWLPNCS